MNYWCFVPFPGPNDQPFSVCLSTTEIMYPLLFFVMAFWGRIWFVKKSFQSLNSSLPATRVPIVLGHSYLAGNQIKVYRRPFQSLKRDPALPNVEPCLLEGQVEGVRRNIEHIRKINAANIRTLYVYAIEQVWEDVCFLGHVYGLLCLYLVHVPVDIVNLVMSYDSDASVLLALGRSFHYTTTKISSIGMHKKTLFVSRIGQEKTELPMKITKQTLSLSIQELDHCCSGKSPGEDANLFLLKRILECVDLKTQVLVEQVPDLTQFPKQFTNARYPIPAVNRYGIPRVLVKRLRQDPDPLRVSLQEQWLDFIIRETNKTDVLPWSLAPSLDLNSDKN